MKLYLVSIPLRGKVNCDKAINLLTSPQGSFNPLAGKSELRRDNPKERNRLQAVVSIPLRGKVNCDSILLN